MMRTVRLAFASLAVTLLLGPVASADLMGSTFGGTTPSVLYDVNQATGATSNPRPTGLTSLAGIAFNNSGTTLYGVNALGSSLYTIDATTGGSSLVGALGVDVNEGDLGFDLAGNLFGLYSSSQAGDSLFRVNTTTGAGTLVGTLSGVDDASGLAFDNSGSLLILDTNINRRVAPELLVVNPDTAAVISRVAITGLSGANALAGMAVDRTTGIPYVAFNAGLYTPNQTTGAASFVGSTSVTLSGLAYRNDAGVVPESSSLALAGLGVGLTGLVARRRRGG